MNRPSLAVLAASLVLLPGLAAAETLTIDAPEFTGIEAATGIRVIATAGGAQSVVAESPRAEDIADLRWEVRDDTLKLWYDWTIGDIFDWSVRNITVTVSARSLDDLTATSGARIEATGLAADDIDLDASSGGHVSLTGARADEFDIEVSSGARIEVAGACGDVDIEASSGASVAARDLACAEAEITGSSGASIEVFASRSISAELSSGASALVFGQPAIDRLESSSGGSIRFEK